MINSDDHMSAPALPALASLQLRKCKGIRDLTARAGSNSQAGPVAFLAAQTKALEVEVGTTTGNQGAASCKLGLPTFCRFWPRRFAGGRTLDNATAAASLFPIKARNESGRFRDGGRLDMCDKSRLHFQTMTTSVGEGAGRLASLAFGTAQTSSPISIDI